MEVDIQFRVEVVDVVHLLNSVAVLGKYRGEEVWGKIKSRIDLIAAHALMVVDVSRASPVDYWFCEYAFRPLVIGMHEGQWPQRHVVFKMSDAQQAVFFKGMMRGIKGDLSRQEWKAKFISDGFYVKIRGDDSKSLQFIGKLDDPQQQVLDTVNKLKEGTVRAVVSRTNLSAESVVAALQHLVSKRFVVGPLGESGPSPRYYSFNNYFVEEQAK